MWRIDSVEEDFLIETAVHCVAAYRTSQSALSSHPDMKLRISLVASVNVTPLSWIWHSNKHPGSCVPGTCDVSTLVLCWRILDTTFLWIKTEAFCMKCQWHYFHTYIHWYQHIITKSKVSARISLPPVMDFISRHCLSVGHTAELTILSPALDSCC